MTKFIITVMLLLTAAITSGQNIIVMSVLNSQSAYVENDAAVNAIHDSQHRVHAMSLIHQKLYSSEKFSSIDMSNSIKYAFPNDMEGVITTSFSNIGLHHYLLTISENGVGLTVHFEDKKPGSLGMSLISGLCEDLEGSFLIENNNGSVIKISFMHDMSIKRPDPLPSSFVTNI